MCFSARVKQKFDQLSRHQHAEVDWEAFDDLFRRRADGEDVKVSRALELNYLHPKTEIQERTKNYIEKYNVTKTLEWETDIFAQRRRLGAAEESLTKKETKKAREDVRIASKKIETLRSRLQDMRRVEETDSDSRIFPLMYAPILVQDAGRTVIRPMRYACRLAGKPANYDRLYPGTYNARRDNLGGFWNKVYGRNHGVMVINGFYENVPKHLYERRELKPDEDPANLVLAFNPRPAIEMLVACVWDHWRDLDADELYSFAAVTDEPPEEISATGHQRCVVSLQEQNVSEWLSPIGVSRERLEAILEEKETPFYEHQIAA
jgi:putative SOS response-associated peptidase YedK